MRIDRASIHRIGRQTIRSENTPYGEVAAGSNRIQRTGSGSAWAYNATGYELYDGYIVAVTGYDPVTNAYTIARPTADDLPNIAVVTSSYCSNSSTARVEITFSGDVFLRYSGTAPTVSNSLGSKSGSFEAKIGGSCFAPLETGEVISGSGRCRSRFFSRGQVTPLRLFSSYGYYVLLNNSSSVTSDFDALDNNFLVDQAVTYILSFPSGLGCAGDGYPSVKFDVYIDFANESDDVLCTAVVARLSGSATEDHLTSVVDFGEGLQDVYPTARIATPSLSIPTNNVASRFRLRCNAINPSENLVMLFLSPCYLTTATFQV